MGKILGNLLLFLGWGCTAWFIFVGGGFSAVFLMGYVGTGGREAGHELVFALSVTVIGAGAGILLVKLGARLSGKKSIPASGNQAGIDQARENTK